MRHRLGFAAAWAVFGLIVGCSDAERTPTTGTTPEIEALHIGFGSACDLKEVRGLSKLELNNQQQNLASDLIKQLGNTNLGAGARRIAGFKLMNLLANNILSNTLPSTHSSENASDFTIAIANCQPGVSVPAISELTQAFADHGIYEVRGLGNTGATEPPIFSRNGGFAAVQAPTVGGFARNFFSWFGGPALVFGWPLDTEFRFGEDLVGQGYEFFAIRSTSSAFSGEGIVALCVGVFPSRLRVQHAGNIQPAVDPSLIFGWASQPDCPVLQPPLAALLHASPAYALQRLLHAGFELLSPPPLSAALLRATTVGSGAGSGSFSEYGAVDAGAVHLSFTCNDFCASPSDGTIGTLSPAAKVRATGDNGSPLPGVQVTLDVAGNSGSFEVCGTRIRLTGPDGVATFSGITLDKPGGYTLIARSVYAGFDPVQATSPLFNLKNGVPPPAC